MSLSPPSLRPGTSNVILERWAAFASFGALLGFGYPTSTWRCIIFAALVASGLEILQEFVPGRHGRLEDAILKLSGAVVGVGVAAAITLLVRRNRPRD